MFWINRYNPPNIRSVAAGDLQRTLLPVELRVTSNKRDTAMGATNSCLTSSTLKF